MTCTVCGGDRSRECYECSPRPPAAPIGVIIFVFCFVMAVIVCLIVVGMVGR